MGSPARTPPPAIPGLLARRGYRLTAPRRAVLAVLGASEAPLTVAEIHDRARGSRANIVSVYRTVNLLTRMGLLRSTDSAQGRRRYELNEQFTGHHHHLICQGCGRIEDLEGCLIDERILARLNARVRESRRFRVTDHELRFFGLCRSCDR